MVSFIGWLDWMLYAHSIKLGFTMAATILLYSTVVPRANWIELGAVGFLGFAFWTFGCLMAYGLAVG